MQGAQWAKEGIRDATVILHKKIHIYTLYLLYFIHPKQLECKLECKECVYTYN